MISWKALCLILLLAYSNVLFAQRASSTVGVYDGQSAGKPTGSVKLLADQQTTELDVFIVEIPAFSFSDTDNLTYTASLNGGPLPIWMDYDPKQNEFTGMPVLGCQGLYSVTITASNGVQSESYAFVLQVEKGYLMEVESQY